MPQTSVEYGKTLDWSAVSRDYLRYRNGYPESFFSILQSLGVGLVSQRILDLGTGTGNLAIPFARQGAKVIGLDPAPGQLEAARERADREGLYLDLIQAPAERSGLPGQSVDAVTASMCWGYFDTAKVVQEVRRLLVPEGLLAITSIIWRSSGNDIAARTNALIKRYNLLYGKSQGDRGGDEETDPAWARGRFRLASFHRYHEAVSFTREQWLGRIRASKWIGAALPAHKADAFDEEHRQLLKRGPEVFDIDHLIRLRVFEPLP
jgi:ubiquinone/menaquinone biosynthesis C-methylase UbiE